MPAIRHDDRLTAAIDLIGRTGAKNVQIRYDDDPEPTVWVVDAEWPQGREAAGALSPAEAAIRLADQVVSLCAHCGRPAGVTEEWSEEMPLALLLCWYVYDPETKLFRRSCEGETTGREYGRDPITGAVVGRNDPCPCNSGLKWKRCHGA